MPEPARRPEPREEPPSKPRRPRVVPVLDLMGGVVVRGIAGDRARYQPVRSSLIPDADPLVLARAFRDRFGFPELYLADLDAIAGRAGHDRAIETLLADGFQLWLDAGTRQLPAPGWADPPGDSKPRMVLGAETVRDWSGLAGMLAGSAAERTLISIDLKAGRLLHPETTPAEEDHDGTAAEPPREPQGDPIDEFIAARRRDGARRLLLLDLADVGVGHGTRTMGRARTLRQEGFGGELWLGGGVRGPGDLDQLAAAGADVVLVASALHDGRLTPADLVVTRPCY